MKQHKGRNIVRVAMVAGALSFLPLAFVGTGLGTRVEVNDGCANHPCCYQPGSICVVGADTILSHKYLEPDC